jgi:hypothetical protein
MKPREAIIAFLEHLPDTIRSDIAAFVLIYAFDEFPTDGELISSIKSKMEAPSVTRQMGRVLRVISALDYVLERAIANSRENVTRLPFMIQEMSDNPAKA